MSRARTFQQADRGTTLARLIAGRASAAGDRFAFGTDDQVLSHLGGRSEAMTGFIFGIIATLLLVLSTLFVAFMIWFAVGYPEEFRTLIEDY